MVIWCKCLNQEIVDLSLIQVLTLVQHDLLVFESWSVNPKDRFVDCVHTFKSAELPTGHEWTNTNSCMLQTLMLMQLITFINSLTNSCRGCMLLHCIFKRDQTFLHSYSTSDASSHSSSGGVQCSLLHILVMKRTNALVTDGACSRSDSAFYKCIAVMLQCEVSCWLFHVFPVSNGAAADKLIEPYSCLLTGSGLVWWIDHIVLYFDTAVCPKETKVKPIFTDVTPTHCHVRSASHQWCLVMYLTVWPSLKCIQKHSFFIDLQDYHFKSFFFVLWHETV